MRRTFRSAHISILRLARHRWPIQSLLPIKTPHPAALRPYHNSTCTTATAASSTPPIDRLHLSCSASKISCEVRSCAYALSIWHVRGGNSSH